jgi:EmrB/QacA subfamily drug resistance transporter
VTLRGRGRAGAPLDRRGRLLVLAICSLSLLISGLDVTVVNVALPSIQHSLHGSVADLQWIADVYTLVLASLLILCGSTADRIGRKRMFMIGLSLFSVGSLLCAVASSLPMLIAFRALQGVGGSMLNPVAMSIVRNTFEDPRERAHAIGMYSSTYGISMALGPVFGGFLLSVSSWRVIFLVNIPVGLAAIALTALFVPESRAPRARMLDPVGQLLVIVGLASLTYGIIEGGRIGFGQARVELLLAVSVVSVIVVIFYELRHVEPLIEIRFFRSVPFAGAMGIAVLICIVLGGFLFMNTLYLQDARGLSPLDAGLYVLPTAVVMTFAGPFSGRLAGRFGTRPSMVIGGLGILVSGLLLTGVSVTTPVPLLLIAYALFGAGFGLLSPMVAVTAVSSMPPAQAGLAAGLSTTSRQVGLTLGVAILGVVTVGGLHGRLGIAVAHATRPGWWIVTALGLVVALLGWLSTTRWAHGTAIRTADRLEHDEVTALGATARGARIGSG